MGLVAGLLIVLRCGDALLLRPRVDGAEAVHFLPAVGGTTAGERKRWCGVAKAMALLLVSSDEHADHSCRTYFALSSI